MKPQIYPKKTRKLNPSKLLTLSDDDFINLVTNTVSSRRAYHISEIRPILRWAMLQRQAMVRLSMILNGTLDASFDADGKPKFFPLKTSPDWESPIKISRRLARAKKSAATAPVGSVKQSAVKLRPSLVWTIPAMTPAEYKALQEGLAVSGWVTGNHFGTNSN